MSKWHPDPRVIFSQDTVKQQLRNISIRGILGRMDISGSPYLRPSSFMYRWQSLKGAYSTSNLTCSIPNSPQSSFHCLQYASGPHFCSVAPVRCQRTGDYFQRYGQTHVLKSLFHSLIIVCSHCGEGRSRGL
jgi:hypothetical protein